MRNEDQFEGDLLDIDAGTGKNKMEAKVLISMMIRNDHRHLNVIVHDHIQIGIKVAKFEHEADCRRQAGTIFSSAVNLEPFASVQS